MKHMKVYKASEQCRKNYRTPEIKAGHSGLLAFKSLKAELYIFLAYFRLEVTVRLEATN